MAFLKRRFKATRLKSVAEFDELLSQGRPVLVDFFRYGCSPCQIMDGIVDEVAEEFQEQAIVVKANADRVPELFQRFKVRSTPTFVLITPKGKALHQRWRHSGLVKKDVMTGQLRRAVESN